MRPGVQKSADIPARYRHIITAALRGPRTETLSICRVYGDLVCKACSAPQLTDRETCSAVLSNSESKAGGGQGGLGCLEVDLMQPNLDAYRGGNSADKLQIRLD